MNPYNIPALWEHFHPLCVIIFDLEPTSFAAFKPVVPALPSAAPRPATPPAFGCIVECSIAVSVHFLLLYFLAVVADVFVAHIRIVRSIVCWRR